MPLFKREKFTAENKAGTRFELVVATNINAEGRFYANLPDYLFVAFGWKGTTFSGRQAPVPEGTFRVVEETYEALRQGILSAIKKHIEPEVTETPVIRYNIESHVVFAMDDDGKICPNAAFPGAKWQDDRKRFGDHHARNCPIGGYSLIIGARAMLKRVIRYGDNVQVEFDDYYANGSHHGRDNPAELLNSWAAIDLGKTPKEMPYSDKAALFFHSLLFGMAALNSRIQAATFHQESLLDLIEISSAAGGGLLQAPVVRGD